MTVSELIYLLNKIENDDAEICVYHYGNLEPIYEVCKENEDTYSIC